MATVNCLFGGQEVQIYGPDEADSGYQINLINGQVIRCDTAEDVRKELVKIKDDGYEVPDEAFRAEMS